jgi:hypothetical protein
MDVDDCQGCECIFSCSFWSINNTNKHHIDIYIYNIYRYIYILYIYTYKYIHIVSIRISSHRAAGLYTEISWARLVGMDQRWQLLAHLDRLEKVTTTVCVDVVD